MSNNIKKEAWEFIKINFKWMIVGTLFLFLWFKGCFNSGTPQAPIVTHDTVVVVHEYQSTPYIPPTINVLPAKPTVVNQPQYQADTSSIQALRKQFQALVDKHTEQRVYNDTLKIDSLGYVNVKDTVSENKLQSRSFNYNIRERQITTTITQPYKARNQVFVGVTVQSLINSTRIPSPGAGFLFKNKKDNVLLINGIYDVGAKSPLVQIGYYPKIKL